MPLVTDTSQVDASTGLLLNAPDHEAGLDSVYEHLPTDAAVVVIQGGTPITRTLLSEEARLARGLTTVLVDDRGPIPALTTVLSGRADATASSTGFIPARQDTNA